MTPVYVWFRLNRPKPPRFSRCEPPETTTKPRVPDTLTLIAQPLSVSPPCLITPVTPYYTNTTRTHNPGKALSYLSLIPVSGLLSIGRGYMVSQRLLTSLPIPPPHVAAPAASRRLPAALTPAAAVARPKPGRRQSPHAAGPDSRERCGPVCHPDEAGHSRLDVPSLRAPPHVGRQ